MSEWYDNQKQSISSIRQLVEERIEKANPRRTLTAEQTKRLAKLESIADKLKRNEPPLEALQGESKEVGRAFLKRTIN